jgi:hypothetical protein
MEPFSEVTTKFNQNVSYFRLVSASDLEAPVTATTKVVFCYIFLTLITIGIGLDFENLD